MLVKIEELKFSDNWAQLSYSRFHKNLTCLDLVYLNTDGRLLIIDYLLYF